MDPASFFVGALTGYVITRIYASYHLQQRAYAARTATTLLTAPYASSLHAATLLPPPPPVVMSYPPTYNQATTTTTTATPTEASVSTPPPNENIRPDRAADNGGDTAVLFPDTAVIASKTTPTDAENAPARV